MKQNLLKLLLNIWIFLTLAAMLVMPNAWSYLGRHYSTWVSPYANAVGLNSSWNFFSPDPAQTMYLHYTVYFLNAEGVSTQDPVDGYFPRDKNKMTLDTTQRRELYAMRFMLIGKNRLQALFSSWLCRHYPGASGIHVETIIETVAPLDQVVSLPGDTLQDLSQEVPYQNIDYNCGSPEEEYPL